MGGENPVATVARPELTAVHRHQFSAEQLQLPTQCHKLFAHRGEGLGIVGAKIRDRFEIRCKLVQQPHHFHVAVRLAFQAPARPHPVQIAIDVQSQQIPRFVSRPPGRGRFRTDKFKLTQIQARHEPIDKAHRIIGTDVFIQAGWKQRRLPSPLSTYVPHPPLTLSVH